MRPRTGTILRRLPAIGERPCMTSGHGDHLLVKDQLVIGDDESLISYDPNTGRELVQFWAMMVPSGLLPCTPMACLWLPAAPISPFGYGTLEKVPKVTALKPADVSP